jgi:hypothetical protein
MYLTMHDSKILYVFADSSADKLFADCGQRTQFFVTGRYLVSRYRIFRYQPPFNINSFLLNADTLRTLCRHTADSGQVFADTLPTLWTKLRTADKIADTAYSHCLMESTSYNRGTTSKCHARHILRKWVQNIFWNGWHIMPERHVKPTITHPNIWNFS